MTDEEFIKELVANYRDSWGPENDTYCYGIELGARKALEYKNKQMQELLTSVDEHINQQ